MKPMPPFGPRARWKTVAITSPDPVEFATEYEQRLNELSSDGWNITGIMQRGEALIITANKPDVPEEIAKALANMVNGPLAQQKPKKMPFHPREDNTTEEIVYAYKEGPECKSIRCGSLEEATDYLEEHIKEDGAILPIGITVMSVTSYEPADLPTLRSICPK